MGKTFVALAVAYSVLERLVAGRPPEGLEGCYQKVVILTPGHGALFNKWYREVDEFVNRCVRPEHREATARWFKAKPCERPDELASQLRKRGGGPRILLAPMDVLARKLQAYDAKRRFLLGALFRYWGNRFQLDRRERLLRGAPEGWPQRPYDVGVLEGGEQEEIPCTEDEAVAALERLDRPGEDGASSDIEGLLQTCREMSEPYARDRDERFAQVAGALNGIYRNVLLALPQSPLPLVIVDEAHNWKNGPRSGTRGYEEFVEHLASRTRRALLLTATPFQLRPQEMLELFKIGEELECAPERSGLSERRERFRKLREEALAGALGRSDRASRRFARVWARLPPSAHGALGTIWSSGELIRARRVIDRLTEGPGLAPGPALDVAVSGAVEALDPAVRAFFTEALWMYAYGRELSRELGRVVIRHRRKTEHREVRVGAEFTRGVGSGSARRSDAHVLHAAPGLDVTGDAELPHYLLMRCVLDTKGGKGRASLGSALTGCYSTLLESAEGRDVQEWLKQNAGAAVHFKLLREMVDGSNDPDHPKVKVVVERVLEAWRRGEKCLLFCFRTHTAERLHEIIHERITKELSAREAECLGGARSLKNLRGRLTRREGDLLPLALDRVLWSFALAQDGDRRSGLRRDALRLTGGDLPALAEVFLRHGIDIDEERFDRVFVSRAVEHVVAKRLAADAGPSSTARLLACLADPAWVEWPYGLQLADEDEAEQGDAYAAKGVHAHYPVRDPSPGAAAVNALSARMAQRWTRARTAGEVSVLDTDADRPSLWFAGPPSSVPEQQRALVRRIHEHVARLTTTPDGFDWSARRQVFEALRRALLRDSVLVRLLPTKTERDERAWGELLVEAFWSPGQQQTESMAHRIDVFLEDLCGASGSFDDTSSARATLLDATRLRDLRHVALVKGGNQKGRERVFAGFNTPLLPEVLVCTSVGAEGIDLHRHCRHVVHYDLAWNPAVLEQRTGRIDRIGSKTFRERALSTGATDTCLEVGVPFLAGTYDERMYEELRLRAQIFEVLTGGDVAADDAEGRDDGDHAEGNEQGLCLVALPSELVDDLRVRLDVWRDRAAPRGKQSGSDSAVA